MTTEIKVDLSVSITVRLTEENLKVVKENLKAAKQDEPEVFPEECTVSQALHILTAQGVKEILSAEFDDQCFGDIEVGVHNG